MFGFVLRESTQYLWGIEVCTLSKTAYVLYGRALIKLLFITDIIMILNIIMFIRILSAIY